MGNPMRIIDPTGMDGTVVTGETQEEYLQRNNRESEQFFNSNGPSNMGGGQIGGVETMAPSGYVAPEEKQGKKSSLGLNGSLKSGGKQSTGGAVTPQSLGGSPYYGNYLGPGPDINPNNA